MTPELITLTSGNFYQCPGEIGSGSARAQRVGRGKAEGEWFTLRENP